MYNERHDFMAHNDEGPSRMRETGFTTASPLPGSSLDGEKGLTKQTDIIAIVNQKGGCGKTTTAVNLSGCLAAEGFKALLVDTDPQAQASLGLGVDIDGPMATIYEVLTKGVAFDKVIQATAVPGLDIVAANSFLSGAQLDLSCFLGREAVLKTAMRKVLLERRYDYIIIDCSPTLNLVTINALAAARHLLIPVQAHYYSLQGMRELFKTIDTVKQRLNPDLKTLGILVTLFDGRLKISQEILKQVNDHFGELVFQTVIRMNVKLCEAPIYKKPIHLYDADSRGAADYAAFMREVILRTERTSPRAMNIDHDSVCLSPLIEVQAAVQESWIRGY